ncbi:hypothetical protein R1flu_001202 [Riccia fluitans]|uniref:Transposase n=1 Tax=Riccia fluitans TaxID=41844 RepID=A0ABD1Y2N1_9MARC
MESCGQAAGSAVASQITLGDETGALRAQLQQMHAEIHRLTTLVENRAPAPRPEQPGQQVQNEEQVAQTISIPGVGSNLVVDVGAELLAQVPEGVWLAKLTS